MIESSYKEVVNAINRLPLQNDHAIRFVILWQLIHHDCHKKPKMTAW